ADPGTALPGSLSLSLSFPDKAADKDGSVPNRYARNYLNSQEDAKVIAAWRKSKVAKPKAASHCLLDLVRDAGGAMWGSDAVKEAKLRGFGLPAIHKGFK